jgi:hypothetical protein
MAATNERLFAIEGQPEVFFTSAETSRTAHYAVRTGRARPIARGIYTRNLTEPLEAVVRRNCWRIAAHLFPSAVVVDRTAILMGPAADDSVTLAAAAARDVRLPGLWLRARKGVEALDSDVPWMGEDLFMSSRARAFLENCRRSRSRTGLARTLSQTELEAALDTYAGRDLENLNRLRDEARALAPALRAEAEFERLDRLIGSLFGTRTGTLASPRGRARARGEPYDEVRLQKFEQLAHHLLATAPPRLAPNPAHELTTFAFFEAYFSNYIEGTEFTVDEAERIVFDGFVPLGRPKDAHDILGTYRILVDPASRARVPGSAADLIRQLQAQHAAMLTQRPEIGPGEFKTEPNRAGPTEFVAPEFVEGTLVASWPLYNALPAGFARAAYAMFLVTEVHPFTDGNGRVARVLMNAELTAAQEQRIIVPTSLRTDYLSGLRAMTHNAFADTYVTVLAGLQAFTAEIDFSSRQAAERDLERRHAFGDVSPQPMLGQALAEAGRPASDSARLAD